MNLNNFKRVEWGNRSVDDILDEWNNFSEDEKIEFAEGILKWKNFERLFSSLSKESKYMEKNLPDDDILDDIIKNSSNGDVLNDVRLKPYFDKVRKGF